MPVALLHCHKKRFLASFFRGVRRNMPVALLHSILLLPYFHKQSLNLPVALLHCQKSAFYPSSSLLSSEVCEFPCCVVALPKKRFLASFFRGVRRNMPRDMLNSILLLACFHKQCLNSPVDMQIRQKSASQPLFLGGSVEICLLIC